MSSAAFEVDLVEDEVAPESGIQRAASVAVLEPTLDLAGALLEACGAPASVARLLSVHLVPRRRTVANPTPSI